MKPKVLLLENIHKNAERFFCSQKFEVKTLSNSLSEKELTHHLKGISLLGIRSKTHINNQVISNANDLIAIGAFGIGTNQIDLKSAAQAGIAVFNAPYSNTRSVVELTLAEMIMLARKVPVKNQQMHSELWDKSSKGCFELRGKNLGIIGYGNIGSQLSVLAESLGMNVYFYDLEDKLALGNAKACKSMSQLLKIADVVTLHVDGRPENKNMFSKKQFNEMKKGAIFLNLSRGLVVDESALLLAVKNQKLAGVGIDVYSKEPKSNGDTFNHPLQGLPNVILTPHIGSGTDEAQQRIAEFVPNKLFKYFTTGNSKGSVNFPQLNLPTLNGWHRVIHIHKNVPGILAKINQIMAKQKINIEGQYLKTNETIGYVITDINHSINQRLLTQLKDIPNTIKVRCL